MDNYILDIAKEDKKDRFNGIIKVLEKNNIKYVIQKIPGFNTFGNIVIEFNPSIGKKIVLSAHYDNANNTPGANDNAAACSIVLSHILKNKDTKEHIEYVFFDLEENGFYGSRYYLYLNKDKIKYVINMDMCGIGDTILYSHDNNIGKNSIINNVFSKYNALKLTKLPVGDAYTFINNNIETFYIINSTKHDVDWFISYSHGKQPRIYPDFLNFLHKPNDTIDNINLKQVSIISDFVNDLINEYSTK